MRFPKSCCEVASYLLAYYLRDMGFSDVRVVCGTLDFESEEQFHVWLEVDGWIIDITADQFPRFSDPVIVTPHDGSWHSQLSLCCGWEDTDGFPPTCSDRYEKVYTALKRQIDSGAQNATRIENCIDLAGN